ncbi:hypothetical protein lerEdw1_003523 [Lerista edwardsae]|nr:hypothetical protein lerEdw1_003523 [Lerista edwardsae]
MALVLIGSLVSRNGLPEYVSPAPACKMASLWHLLLMVLSSLLLVAGYKLPTLRFLFQNGASEANVEARNLRIQSESPKGAPGRWEWKTGEDGGREFPQRPRRRRAAVTISIQAHDNNTGLGVAGTSADAPTTVHTLARNLTEASRVAVATHKNTTESTPTTFTDLYEDDTTEGVASTGTSLSQNSSVDGTGRTTAALKRTMEVSTVTTGKAPLVDVAQPSTSSQTLVGTSDVSTGMLRPTMVTPGPSFRAKGTVREVSATAKAASPTPTTIPAKLPSQNAPPVTPSLVGQCLLAIFLLALVAGIFVILSTVLAILLWRQKRAYKLSRDNHTEMVCISSLLAHDEAEEAGGRHPRVRRMRMLGENGPEAEMDNLTLNSFLPDH